MRMTVVKHLVTVGAFLLMLRPAPGRADEPSPKKEKELPAQVSYYKDVRPLFAVHCQGCHQPAKPQGGYVMTSHAALFKTTDKEEPGIVAGKPAECSVIAEITPKNGKAKMPKGKPPLSDYDIKLISRWIEQGAKDDTPVSAKEVPVDPEHPPIYQLPPVVTGLDFSPDGKLVAVSGYHEVLLHHADGSGLVARLVGLAERVQSMAFSPNGDLLAVCGGSPGRFGEIQVWDVAKKKLRLSQTVTYDTTYGLSWSPDGTKVAFGCTDNTLRAIDVGSGEQVLFQGAHNDWVLNTIFSSDGLFVASISRDRSMKLTELSTQRFIDNITSITPGALKGGLIAIDRRPLHDKRLVKSPPDPRELVYNELVVGGSDGVPRVYKMHREVKRVIGDDANKVREFEAMPGRIFAIRCNADGTRFAAASSADGHGEVRVYRLASAQPKPAVQSLAAVPTMASFGLAPVFFMGDYRSNPKVATFEGQKGPVYAVVFRPDGQVVASGGFDGVVRLNDAASGKLIKEFSPVPLQAASK
jgi:WD40 repeat protein